MGDQFNHKIHNIVCTNFVALDKDGNIRLYELDRTAHGILNYQNMTYDQDYINKTSYTKNDKLIKFALNNYARDEYGRLIMLLFGEAKQGTY